MKLNLNRRVKKQSQRGSSDGEMVILIVVIITLATIAYLILGWIKSVKDERVERNVQTYIEQHRKRPSRQEREPSGHQLEF